MGKTGRAKNYFLNNPEASVKDVMAALGVSERTAQRAKYQLDNPIDMIPPRVLLVDIETIYMLVSVWGLYKQRIPIQNIEKEWSIVGWAAKWMYEPEIMSDICTAEEVTNRDDKRILDGLWHLLEDCDVAIAHNLKRFDRRKINARLLINGFMPPMSYQTIDTLVESRKNFAFSSHKQDYLTKLLKLPEKLSTNYALWKRCANDFGKFTLKDQKKALREMQRYNIGDIRGLEEVYTALLPWMPSTPNMGLFLNATEPICPKPGCGSRDLDWRGYYYTQVGRYRAFRCNDCGGIGRARTSTTPKDVRKHLTISVSR